MRCSNCGKDNPQGLNFCNQCGAGLKPRCSKCGFENEPGARFCGNCGTSLSSAAPVSAAVERPEAAGTTEVRSRSQFGERRHLTVLFCDLMGSTELAAQLDPEEWHETVAAYHRSVAETVSRFGGRVAKFLGDGVMAYFGYPEAHENDAERAARAGLAMIEAISKLHQAISTEFKQSTRPKLSARVGIDSGRVVVSTDAGTDIDIFGEAPNIAARVQAAAAPDTVLITASTYRLVTGLFVVEDCGSRAFKGIEQPLQLYRVIQPERARGRLAAAAASRGLTAFVGREDELGLLTNRWQRVVESEGQVLLIVGEAGIGKSRLVQQFRQHLAGAAHTWIEAAAAPFYQNTPFFPIAEALWQLVWEQSLNRFGDYLRKLQRQESGEDGGEEAMADERLDDLHSGLISAGLTPAEAIPLLAPLMHLPTSAKYAPSALTAEQQRRRLLATLVEWLLGATRSQPLVIVIEDLHWADPSTLELIQLLAQQGAAARLLLLCTARPEFRPEWPLRAHHTQIALSRLNARHVRAMIAQVAAQNALANQTLDAVVERTSGVPLFVEELTRAVLESGNAALTDREIPVTLHDSLMARLDRLGSAREVLQIGSVIGSQFSYELLHAVHPLDHQELQHALRRLTDSDLLHVRGLAPDSKYQFKHALIRDAAYEALLKSRRRELHGDVARAIDEKFQDIRDAHPEVLARHWSEAGESERAIQGWQKAGDQAVERFAFREAEQHYREALALVATLPRTTERDSRELALQLALGSVVTATRGFSASATAEVYSRAHNVAEVVGDADSLDVLFAEYSTAHTRGEARRALVVADQMLEIATAQATPRALSLAHNAQALPRVYLGDLAGARQHFLLAIEHYREDDFVSFRVNPGGNSLTWGGLNEWLLGYPDQATRHTTEAIAIARRQNNRFEVTLALNVDAQVQSLRRNLKQALDDVTEMVALSSTSGIRLLNSIGKIHGAWISWQLGECSNAVEIIRAGLAELDEMEFYLARSRFLGYLAQAQAGAGELDDAMNTLEVAVHPNPDSMVYRPEMLRLRGEARFQRERGSPVELERAAADFRESIALARRMGAKAWELRSATSLAQLFATQGRRDEARKMVAEIYNWFTEGFDTPDLKDAKALLDDLSG